MMKQEIQNEIDELEKTKFDWTLTRKDKNEVFELLSRVSNFNHTFTVRYNYAKEFYYHNSVAEIAFTDGIKDLESYSTSKLKRKDDHYYYSGIKNLKKSLDTIIRGLKDKKEEY